MHVCMWISEGSLSELGCGKGALSYCGTLQHKVNVARSINVHKGNQGLTESRDCKKNNVTGRIPASGGVCVCGTNFGAGGCHVLSEKW